MQIDTVSSPDMPGLVELGISPDSVEAILLEMLPISGRKKPLGNPLQRLRNAAPQTPPAAMRWRSGAYMACAHLMVRSCSQDQSLPHDAALSTAPLVRLSERRVLFPAPCRQTLTHAFCDRQSEDMHDDSPS
jgi:hypothetical protein